MLSLDTAYRSFGGEVEASSTPTICRLPDSRHHQLSAIARGGKPTAHRDFVKIDSISALGLRSACLARSPRLVGDHADEVQARLERGRKCLVWSCENDFGPGLPESRQYPRSAKFLRRTRSVGRRRRRLRPTAAPIRTGNIVG